MIQRYINGDLLDLFEQSNFDAIVHGCNCFHLMKSGIAGAISQRFPEAPRVDAQTELGNWEKLGTYSKVEYHFGTLINGYTQYRPGRCPESELLSNIKKLFTQLNTDFKGKTIGIPYIGCGIAGGNWGTVSKLIHEVTPDLKIVVVYL